MSIAPHWPRCAEGPESQYKVIGTSRMLHNEWEDRWLSSMGWEDYGRQLFSRARLPHSVDWVSISPLAKLLA